MGRCFAGEALMGALEGQPGLRESIVASQRNYEANSMRSFGRDEEEEKEGSVCVSNFFPSQGESITKMLGVPMSSIFEEIDRSLSENNSVPSQE